MLDLADEAIGKRSGRHVIAARARDRAVTLLDDHRYLDALEEFHRAKYEWWSGETVRGSLLAMIIIAKLCLELRLPQASKSYALAVSYIAALRREEEIEDLIPTGLLVAASADFIAGAWSSAAEMYELGLTTQYELIGDGTDWEKHKELQNAYLHLAYINACARAVDRQRQSLRNLIEAIPEDAWTQQSNAIGSRQYSQFGGAQRKAVSLLRGFCVGSSRAIGFSSFFSSAATESCHLMWRITCRYHALVRPLAQFGKVFGERRAHLLP